MRHVGGLVCGTRRVKPYTGRVKTGDDGAKPIAYGGTTLRDVPAGPFRVSEVEYGASLHQQAHSHDRACLTFVMQGAFTERIVGEQTRCGSASVLLKPPHLRHACSGCQGDTRCITLEIDESTVAELGPVGTIWDRAGYADGTPLWSLMTRVSEELQRVDAAAPLALEGLCMDLLAELYRLTVRPRGQTPQPWLVSVVDLLRTGHGAQASLADLSEQVGVHRAHLAREFRKHYGCTVGAFARQLRLQHACDLLLRPELSLAEVAVSVGFYDQSHFTNAFRSHLGITPGEYRQSRIG